MTSAPRELLLRLVAADAGVEAEIAALAASGTTDVPVLVAAAVLAGDSSYLHAAHEVAVHPRDRQLVALSRALVSGDPDLFDALVRDHLVTYPDHLLATWLAARTR